MFYRSLRKCLVPVSIGTFLLGLSVSAQNIYPSTGNVGIGTASPSAPVTVSNSSSVKLDLTGSSNQNGIILDAAGSADQYYIGAGNNLMVTGDKGFIVLDTSTMATKLFVNSSGDVSMPTGNVGIGTAIVAPWASAYRVLDIYGFGYLYGSSNGTGYVGTGYGQTAWGNNTYFDGSSHAIGTGAASSLLQGAGYLTFSNAPSVNAGNAQTFTERFRIDGSGNVGIGTTAPTQKLEVNGNILLTAGSGATMTFPDGTTQSTAWNGTLGGGDYAESVSVAGDRMFYEPGDVMVMDPKNEGAFLKAAGPYSTFVAGIYSTKPGLVGRRQLSDRSHMKEEVPMAITGIVPTKVSAENGPIALGDLLVSSSKPGYAMKGTDREKMLGAVIGKALGHLDSGTGVIELLVTLQ